MNRGKSTLAWTGLFILGIILFAHITVIVATPLPEPTSPGRSDGLLIDSMAAFGKLQRQVVLFFHDKHTDALDKQKKGCQTCHPATPKEELSSKFMRLKDPQGADPQALMDLYHNECIGCHKDNAAAKKAAAPVECRQCHREADPELLLKAPMGFDKSLHYRHVRANQKKCNLCHHEYNLETKTLFYAKEKEGTCRYCHLKGVADNRISMRSASHQACIGCHQDILAQNRNTGPLKCRGCHDLAEQALIEKVIVIPRMDRKQPDRVFVKNTVATHKQNKADLRMNPVPFNHLAHEKANDTCRVCHHAALDACANCHISAGAKEGGYVNLEQVMHRNQSAQSCRGCHQINQARKECAGCHKPILKTQSPDTASCISCHLPLPAVELRPPEPQGLADLILKSRRAVSETFGDADIPEKVLLGVLSEKYEPVDMPHRKMIQTLVADIRQDRLAGFFHREKATVCQGCHHRSPGAKKPPSCASCHSRPFDENDLNKPGLMAAYHQQCMGCHTAMGINKPVATDCTGCHIEKKV